MDASALPTPGLPLGYAVAAALAAVGMLLTAAGIASTARWRFLHRRIREYVAMEPKVELPEVPTPTRRPPGTAARQHRTRLGHLQRRLAGTSLGTKLRARLVRLDPRTARRLSAFEQQLPQAIDAMASSLRAGSTLQQAMAVLGREMTPPLSVEFQRVLRETEVGLTFPDALAGLAQRVPSGDVALFISAVSIQQRVGGDLSQILRTISHTIRERLRVRGEVRVLSAQARISSYIVAALPVLLFLFLWTTNREYVAPMFLPGITRLLLIAGIFGIVLGFYSMNRLTRVDL